MSTNYHNQNSCEYECYVGDKQNHAQKGEETTQRSTVHRIACYALFVSLEILALEKCDI